MRVVLDTNVLLVSITPKSIFYPIFDSFLKEEYELCVTTEILLEYEEILKIKVGLELASAIISIIENAPNTIFITRYFEWNLITVDLDDNKFVDCAIAANAKLLVTEDKHFNVLKQISFPKVQLINIKKFITFELNRTLNDN